MFTMVPYRRYLSSPARTFDNFLSDPFFRNFFGNAEGLPGSSFRVNILEADDSFTIEAEMPGLNEEQINLEVDNGMLTISADFQTETKEENKGRMYTERRSGHSERSFNLDGINAEDITANYRNGVLYVKLPKEKPIEKSARKIPVITDGTQTN